jgi:hypothetical protein
LFICPSLRKTSLTGEVEYRLKENNINYSYINNYFVTEDKKYIIITDWSIILETVKSSLVNNNERSLVSDIDQLIGICEIIDNYTFLPIRDIDLSPKKEKRINSYYDLLEKVVDKLKSSLDGINRSTRAPQKYGCCIYFSINKYGLSVDLNMKSWERFADTPFWFTVKYTTNGPNFEQPIELKNRLKEISSKLNIRLFPNSNNDLSFAIQLPTNEVEDVVIADITNHIILIMNALKEL